MKNDLLVDTRVGWICAYHISPHHGSIIKSTLLEEFERSYCKKAASLTYYSALDIRTVTWTNQQWLDILRVQLNNATNPPMCPDSLASTGCII